MPRIKRLCAYPRVTDMTCICPFCEHGVEWSETEGFYQFDGDNEKVHMSPTNKMVECIRCARIIKLPAKIVQLAEKGGKL